MNTIVRGLASILDSSKKEDIIELIRWYALHPSREESLLPGFIELVMHNAGSSKDPLRLTDIVWEKISCDDFLSQFVTAFDQLFSEEEIKYLLAFYKSDVMHKLRTKGKHLFDHVFAGFARAVEAEM
jgi:hypothetical protein